MYNVYYFCSCMCHLCFKGSANCWVFVSEDISSKSYCSKINFWRDYPPKTKAFKLLFFFCNHVTMVPRDAASECFGNTSAWPRPEAHVKSVQCNGKTSWGDTKTRKFKSASQTNSISFQNQPLIWMHEVYGRATQCVSQPLRERWLQS